MTQFKDFKVADDSQREEDRQGRWMPLLAALRFLWWDRRREDED